MRIRIRQVGDDPSIVTEGRLEELGISPDDVLVALGGDGVAVFAREHDDGAAPFFAGDLRSLSVADVLTLISTGRKEGTLRIELAEGSKTLHFSEGEVVYGASTLVEDRLGHALWRAGTLTREQLDELQTRFEPGRRFGEVLTESGFATAADLYQGIIRQVRDIVLSLFSCSQGWFSFVEGERADIDHVRLEESTRDLILAGIRQQDDLDRLREGISWETVYEAAPQPPGVELNPGELATHACIDGIRTAREVIDACELGEFEAVRALHALIEARIAVRRQTVKATAARLDAGGSLPAPGSEALQLQEDLDFPDFDAELPDDEDELPEDEDEVPPDFAAELPEDDDEVSPDFAAELPDDEDDDDEDEVSPDFAAELPGDEAHDAGEVSPDLAAELPEDDDGGADEASPDFEAELPEDDEDDADDFSPDFAAELPEDDDELPAEFGAELSDDEEAAADGVAPEPVASLSDDDDEDDLDEALPEDRTVVMRIPEWPDEVPAPSAATPLHEAPPTVTVDPSLAAGAESAAPTPEPPLEPTPDPIDPVSTPAEAPAFSEEVLAEAAAMPFAAYSKAISRIHGILKKARRNPEALNSYFEKAPASYQGLFEGVRLEEGLLDMPRLLENARRLHGEHYKGRSVEALDAYQNFALFQAKNALPPEIASKLQRLVMLIQLGKA